MNRITSIVPTILITNENYIHLLTYNCLKQSEVIGSEGKRTSFLVDLALVNNSQQAVAFNILPA